MATKYFFPVFSPLIILLVILRVLVPGNAFVGFFQYGICLALAISILTARKHTRIQKRLGLSLIFLLLGDFFLIFVVALRQPPINMKIGIDCFPFGILAFLAAYAIMISAYLKNITLSWRSVLIMLPILALFIFEVIFVSPHVQGILLIGLILFGVVLCCLAWSGINTILSRHYTRQAAWQMAISASLIMLGDLAVGFNQFHPLFTSAGSDFGKWLDAFIVLIYLPGWVLVGIIACQDKPIEA